MSEFKIIENTDPDAAISVYDEAATVYWKLLKSNPELTKRTSFHQLRCIFDTCIIPAIDKVRQLDREGRNISSYTDIELLHELVKRNPTMEAPREVSYGVAMLETLVAVGKDETASIYLHEDAIKFMDNSIDKDDGDE